MSDEIEEFIRRAAERRKQQAQGRRPAPRPAQPPPAPPQLKRAPLAQPLEPEIVAAEVIDDDVAEYVARHIDTRDFQQRASTLGATPAHADDRLEARLHHKFDHQLGSLQETTVDPVVPPEPPSVDISIAPTVTHEISDVARAMAEMFRSPLSIRQAFIMSEVMKRPQHW